MTTKTRSVRTPLFNLALGRVLLPSGAARGDDLRDLLALYLGLQIDSGVVATPPRPGLIRDPAGGQALEVEIYQLPVAALGTLLLTTTPTSPRYGSWRHYLAALSNAGRSP